MNGEERALADVAASVADGDAIDWQTAESAIPSAQRTLVRQLRLVETISRVYRTLPEPPQADSQADFQRAEQRWGRLILLEKIGQGTSCDVYRAWDTELHRDVALKLFHEDGVRSTSAHQHVMEEARRLARVEHPHIVRVYGAEQHDGRVGFWMELVRGDSLEHIVGTRGPFSAADAAAVGQEMCAALAAVHGAGLLHRDVKAQNVMRDAAGRTVLMDFGTGEMLQRNAGTNRFIGTPLYLAPEIFEGRPATPQSDLYSLGVMLFYLATGQYPHSASSMKQLADAHGRREMRSVRELRPDLPEKLAASIDRALERDPDRRFRTAAEMGAALQLAPDSAPAATRQAAVGWRWSFAAAAAVFLLAAVALIVWTRQAAVAVPGAIKTIAVAPMTAIDASGVPPFFAEGLTDQLISTLGQIQSLRVKSSPVGSVTGSRDSTGPLMEGVDAIVQTTLLVGGRGNGGKPRARVNARLIAAGTHTVLWSNTFEEDLGDAFVLQARIARDITSAIRAAVTPAEQARLDRPSRTNAVAEAAFLEGRAHIEKYGVDDWRHALEAFQRAVDADPDHAAARAGIARAHFALGFSDAISQPAARALALVAAQEAIRLDAQLPEAHATLADIAFYYDWNWKTAEEGYRRSLSLNNSFVYGRTQYAQFLAAARRTTESVAQAQAVVDLQPTSALAYRTLGLMLYYHRDFKAATAAVQRSLEFEPNAPSSRIILGRIAEAEGDLLTALRHTDQALALLDRAPAVLEVQKVRLRALIGRSDEAIERLNTLRREAEARGTPWNPQFDAYLRLALGQQEEALDYFDKAVEQRQPSLLWLGVDPRLDPIRHHPRFVAIVRRLGIA